MQLITASPRSFHCYSLLHPRRMHPQGGHSKRAYATTKLIISAATRRKDDYSYDHEFGGKFVDENMVVLRKRIHEMKMTEAKCDAPEEWMEWERTYYCKRYNSDICQAVGVLQLLLINTRPSLALGMAALIALSIPLSAGVTIFRLVELAMWLAAEIHL